MDPAAADPSKPRVTVVICTRDRAALLGDCLDLVLQQEAPPGGFHVLVVDNGSRDATAEVVAARLGAGQLGEGRRLSLVHQADGGLSAARNAALHAVDTDVVAYLDDDARPRPGWLGAITAAFDDPAVAVAGGPVFALWPGGARPAWLPPALEGYYSVLPGPRRRGPAAAPWWPIGANLAARTQPARTIGGFSEVLGRTATSLRSNEDGDFVARMGATGHVVWFEPAAAVDHVIPEERARRRWLLRRSYWQGRSDASAMEGSVLLRAAARSRSRVVRAGTWLPRLVRDVVNARHPIAVGCHLAWRTGRGVEASIRMVARAARRPPFKRSDRRSPTG